ncbi:recombinase family protein [Planomicrobium sp. Y74]|uniref:recombinase family protein n=1 Tax=Planomicrobium sp. Y74 TaxID=2478977 RepID=UPI00256FBD4B|nr:recombinase family protein [Planomicrobium sp. Y74]
MAMQGYQLSSVGQNFTTQINQLKDAGCISIYNEEVSSRNKNNKLEFVKLLEVADQRDAIVVTKLDRLAGTTIDTLSIIDSLDNKGASLILLNLGGDRVNTGTTIGKIMITVLSGIAEFEEDIDSKEAG